MNKREEREISLWCAAWRLSGVKLTLDLISLTLFREAVMGSCHILLALRCSLFTHTVFLSPLQPASDPPSRSHLLLPDGRPCFSAPASPALRFIIALRYDISGREKGIKTPQGVAVGPAGVTPDSPALVTYLDGCGYAHACSRVFFQSCRFLVLASVVCMHIIRGTRTALLHSETETQVVPSLLLFRRVNRNGGEPSGTHSRYIPSAGRRALVQVTVLVAAFLAISFLTPCCCFHPRHMPLNVDGGKVSPSAWATRYIYR